MKTANDCRTRNEYHHYHAKITLFFNKPSTTAAIGINAVNAIKQMKRDLCLKEHKLAGYVCHGIKSNMMAMTTSPAKCHNKHICHGKDKSSCKHHIQDALHLITTHIQRAFCKRREQAHDEFSSVAMFSRDWTLTHTQEAGVGGP